jgi:LacI family transcriptional regulator
VLNALQKKNLSCPEIGVIGGGDFPLGSVAKPSLTTISYPYYQVGREATQLLFDVIRMQTVEPAHRRFVPKLIVRESTRLAGLPAELARSSA